MRDHTKNFKQQSKVNNTQQVDVAAHTRERDGWLEDKKELSEMLKISIFEYREFYLNSLKQIAIDIPSSSQRCC